MRTVKVLALISVVALAIPMAGAADTKNDIGVVVGYIAPTNDSTIPAGDAGTPTKTEVGSTIDYGLAYKFKFRPNMSFGFNLLYSDHDVKQAGEKIATLSNMPVLLDFNFHLLQSKNLFIGLTVGYAWWGDIKFDQPIEEGGPSSRPAKSDWVYGLNLGWDFPIGKNLAVLTNVRYLGQKVEPDEPGADSVNVNPVVANVGLAFRF